MASDGVSGAHGPHKGLGLILLMWRMWSLDGCGEVPGTVKNGQVGRRQGDLVGGRVQPEGGGAVVLMGRTGWVLH